MSWSVIESWEDSARVSYKPNGIAGDASTVRKFTVSVPEKTSLQVVDAPGLPRPGSSHPSSLFLVARHYNIRKMGPLYFEVLVEYEGNTPDPTNPADNPLSRSPVISFGSVTQEVEIDYALDVFPSRTLVGDSYPIQTINGEPIVGVTQPFTDLVVIVERNLASFDPDVITTYTNKVNSQTWFGCPAGTTRIMNITARSNFNPSFPYWEATASFQVRRGRGPVPDSRAWWHRVPHQGYIINNSAGTRLDYAKADPGDDFTSRGTTVSQPVMLDNATGERLASGDADYVEFKVLDTIDFNLLNIL
jgi:hypothetical protein